MPDIRISKDKAQIVIGLKKGSEFHGPFETYADVLAFAAALAVKRRARSAALSDTTSKEPDPVGYDIFVSRHYEDLIDLVALYDTRIPSILAKDAVDERAKIFEEYADGGLDILSAKLAGSNDHTQRLLLLLGSERESPGEDGGFDDLLRGLSSL